jgi:hypothetical protein
MEYILAGGALGVICLAILLWWETRKRVQLERLLASTEKVLSLRTASLSEIKESNLRLVSLVYQKEKIIRELETQLDPGDRFDELFGAPKGRDGSRK